MDCALKHLRWSGWLAAGALSLLMAAGPGQPAVAQSTFDCVMDPSESVRVGSPVVGLLASVSVSRGDRIEKGQEIGRLESKVEAATVKMNRARANGTARVEAQEARLELSRKRFERASQLLQKQAISRDRFDELTAEQKFDTSELAREKLELRLARLEYERSKMVLEQRTIRSPIAGVVSEKALSAGEFVIQEGHIVTLSALDPLHVEVFLPVELYPQITTGMTGIVRPDPPIGGAFDAEVTVVDRVFDAASGTFGIRLSLPNPEGLLPAGHRCTVSFDLPVAITQ